MLHRAIIKPCGKDSFELVADLHFNEHCVGAGYITNGADIPRVFWSLYPPNSPEYLSAAILHDYLCDEADRHGSIYTYKQADKVFYEALKELKVSSFKARLFYISCRVYHILKGKK